MTDKEKIKAEIERLKESGCASPIVICDTLLAFIDSMQEEPASEVWHDASEKPIYKSYSKNGNQIAVYGKTSIGYGMSICSLIDNNTIYSPVAKKEYVWGDCPFTKWAYTSDLLNLDNSCNFGKNLQEEPVSEDLEEAATTFADVHVYATRMVCFKAGANWQKQQMMKNAVNTEVCHIFGDKDKAFFPMYGMDMKQGDKVKLIIIKQKEE